MQKPTSVVSFLLTLTALVLFVVGIITAVTMYQMWDSLIQAYPALKSEHFEAIWLAGLGFFFYFVLSLVLLALAQISDSTATSAGEAGAQTEILQQIAASLEVRAPGGGPSIDDTARKIAGEINLQRRRQ